MITQSEVRQVNREYRRLERMESNVWPVNRLDFDLADRVIAVARYIRQQSEDCHDAAQYADLLYHVASQIVNDSRLWSIGLRSTLRLLFEDN